MLGAILGSSVIGAVSSNAAAKAQESAANKANDTQKYIFDRTVKLTQPQRKIGNNALAGMASLYGLGDAPQGFTGFQADPGYQFRLDQGQTALERMAAARGLRMGSATLKAANDYGQGMASQEYGNWYNRLAGLAGVGQQATGQQIAAGQNYANQVGQNYLAAGDAKASGYTGFNDAFQGGINNYFGYQGYQDAFKTNASGSFSGSLGVRR